MSVLPFKCVSKLILKLYFIHLYAYTIFPNKSTLNLRGQSGQVKLSETQVHQSGAQGTILPDDDELTDNAEFKV